ncbi:hypothetical protein PBCVCZ2_091R [Paramecium bursaria Chlorella virus CZ-2]|nr:hypothetical protein PBCVCZ2_091R [Paramecium bursaria Chlorella virus CZ-2]
MGMRVSMQRLEDEGLFGFMETRCVGNGTPLGRCLRKYSGR